MSEVRRTELWKEILHVMRDEADPVNTGTMRERFFESQWTPFLLGGAAGAVWMLLFVGDVAHADDCLRYVRKVQNFIQIPKDLLEDCMRTGIVQAILTGALGTAGGGLIAVAVINAIKSGGEPWKKGGTGTLVPPGEKEDTTGEDETVDASKFQTCPSCNASFYNDPANPTYTKCPYCRKPVPPPEGVETPPTAACPACGNTYLDTGRGGKCPNCDAALPRTEREPEPEGKTEPADPSKFQACPSCGASFYNDPANPTYTKCPYCKEPIEDRSGPKPMATCPECGKEYQDTGQGGKCAYCEAALPANKGKFTDDSRTNVSATCPTCGETYYSEVSDNTGGLCPNCQAPVPPIKLPEEVGPPSDVEQVFEKSECRFCGGPLPRSAPDSRCPACGARNDTTPKGTCPNCGASVGAGDDSCSECGGVFRKPKAPDETKPADATSSSKPSGDSTQDATTTASGANPSTTSGGATTTPGSLDPDPVFTSQNVITGDKAANILEEAGLAKVTRDSNGKPIRIEEAFPGAFTNLGGQNVTIKSSESLGDGAEPDWVEESKAKVAGIAFKPGPDGGIGDPVIVVNQTDSKWRQLPPDPIEQGIQAAKDAVNQIFQQGSSAVQSAQDSYADLKSKLELADKARGAYEIVKAGMDKEMAEDVVAKLAKELKVDPAQAMKLLEMEEKTWQGIRAGVKLPGTFLGN